MQPASRVLADQLRSDIAGGRWKVGEKIPSERQLASEHQIARNTAREAIRLLAHEGLLAPRHGSGVYVTPHLEEPEDRDEFFEEFDAQGWDTPPLIELTNLTGSELTAHSHTRHITSDAFALDYLELAPSKLGFYVGTDEIVSSDGTVIATVTSAARGDDINEYEWLTDSSGAIDVETELFNSEHEVGSTTVKVRTRDRADDDDRDQPSVSRLVILTLTHDRGGHLILITRLDAAGHSIAMTLNPESRRAVPITAERLISPLLSR